MYRVPIRRIARLGKRAGGGKRRIWRARPYCGYYLRTVRRIRITGKQLIEAAACGNAPAVRAFLDAFGVVEGRCALTGSTLPCGAGSAVWEAMAMALGPVKNTDSKGIGTSKRTVGARRRAERQASVERRQAEVVRLLTPVCARVCDVKALD